jgi:hypothetical protein
MDQINYNEVVTLLIPGTKKILTRAQRASDLADDRRNRSTGEREEETMSTFRLRRER